MTTNDSFLTDLLPSNRYRLAYALPLLFVSLFINTSGTFFTLDRTRSFAPTYHYIPGGFDTPKSKLKYLLEGGAGGLGIGFLFGVHLSTLLALAIPAKTSSPPLSPGAFIAVWLLPAIVTTLLGSRWKWASFALAGLLGGATLAVATSVIIHPSLITRIVLLAVFAILFTIAALLPFPRTQHLFLRLATSTLGAFGVILAISILVSIPAWANVWERLWVDDDILWGSSQEKGLSAGFCLFQVFGALCDFLLNWKFGECPDKQWDQYLAKYTANLPDRAGSFRPLTSLWDRIFGKTPTEDHLSLEKDIIFPPDTESRIPTSPSQKASYQPNHDFLSAPAYLKKSRSSNKQIPGFKARREGVKFRSFNEGLSSNSEDELDTKLPPRRLSLQKFNSAATLVEEDLDIDKEYAKIEKPRPGFFITNGIPEYSDYEEDLASISTSRREKVVGERESGKSWSPGFLHKHSSAQSSTNHSTSQGTSTTAVEPTTLLPTAVPATPSLIRALDRIAIAQKDAYGHASPRSGLPPSSSSNVAYGERLPTTVRTKIPKSPDGPKWGEFWDDVDNKVYESR